MIFLLFALALLLTYKAAYRRGTFYGARYAMRYGKRLVTDPAFLVAQYEKRHPQDEHSRAAS